MTAYSRMMVACGSAASLCSPSWCLILFVWSLLLIDMYQSTNYYSRQDLINIGVVHSRAIMLSFHRTHNIPDSITRKLGSPWVVIPVKRCRRRDERKQKWGCRAGVSVRLRKDPHRPLIPSLFLSNGHSSVAHKMAIWSYF